MNEVCLVILGAGASYDCIPTDPGGGALVRKDDELLGRRAYGDVRLPLTQDLARESNFNNAVLMRYPAARPVVDELRRRLARAGGPDTLESVLDEYQQKAAIDPAFKRHIMAARFYLRDLLWGSSHYMAAEELTGGVTNYVTLVNRLHLWAHESDTAVCLVTFNYDLLIDYACHAVWDFREGNLAECIGHLADQRMMLLKPHGSVSWEWRHSDNPAKQDGARSGYMIDRAATLDDDEYGSLEVAADPWTPGGVDTQGFGVPALALPIASKTGLVWPADHAAAFESLSGEVGRVITIGWRGAEDHFLPLLTPLVRPEAPRLVVTGGEHASDECAALHTTLEAHTSGTRAERSFIEGFAQFMRESDVLDEFLQA